MLVGDAFEEEVLVDGLLGGSKVRRDQVGVERRHDIASSASTSDFGLAVVLAAGLVSGLGEEGEEQYFWHGALAGAGVWCLFWKASEAGDDICSRKYQVLVVDVVWWYFGVNGFLAKIGCDVWSACRHCWRSVCGFIVSLPLWFFFFCTWLLERILS